jgi:predicted DCC family thiol-disulfide oxidoreductase YuxK
MSVGDLKPNGDAARDLWVVYDGECPFCSSYVTLYRIRQQTDHVHLIDARSADPVVNEVRRAGYDLDIGMVVKFEGRLYHGAEAMTVLAILGSDGTIFNRLNRTLFRHPRLARALYPWLVRGRLLVLRILGRRLIGDAEGLQG